MNAHRHCRFRPLLAAGLSLAVTAPGWTATPVSLDRELQALKAEVVALEKAKLQALEQTLGAETGRRALVIFAAGAQVIEDLTLSGPGWKQTTGNAAGSTSADLTVALSGMATPGRYELTATVAYGVSNYHCRMPLTIMPGAGAQYFELSASIDGAEPNCMLSEWQ